MTTKKKPKSKPKKPLTCPVCKVKFSYNAKSHPMKRLSRHLWSKHRDYMTKKIKAGQRKKRNSIRPLDKEFMAVDDITLAHLSQVASGEHNVQHEQLGGVVLGLLSNLLINLIAEGISNQIGKSKTKGKYNLPKSVRQGSSLFG